jgi:hypothetical protein
MSNTAYSTAQFEQRNAEVVADRSQARDNDPAVKAAKATFNKATTALEDLQSYVATLPLQRRLAYNGNITDAKQAVIDAVKAVRAAENTHVRNVYLAKLEATKAEQQQTQEKQHLQFASEQEAAAKTEMKTWYLSAGGLETQFEQAWPDMWQKELQQRTTENLAGAKRAMNQAHGYKL